MVSPISKYTSQQPVQIARASYSDNTLKILSKDIFICMFRNEIFLFIKRKLFVTRILKRISIR
jgi:hypothetical protein